MKLTWDDDDATRAQVTRRTLTRKQIEENDFKAYLASSGSSSGSASEASDQEASAAAPSGSKSASTKESRRDKLRALLLSGADNEDLPEGWGGTSAPKGDLEVTFMPGLSSSTPKDDNAEETTLERYQRRQKEKKLARKAAQEARASDAKGTKKGMAASGSDDDVARITSVKGDDFFGDEDNETTTKQSQKAKGKKKRDATSDPSAPTLPSEPSTAEELALLLAPDQAGGSGPKHFDMKEVLRAEKEAKSKRKNKRKKSKKGEDVPDEDREDGSGFAVDVTDKRFQALHEEPEFAIDPSNPQ